MAELEALTQYYIAQAGSGNSFYSGPIYQRGRGPIQRGGGVGSFLGGLFRRVLPILKKGTTAVGRELINSGSNFLNDIANNVNPRTAFKNRSKEAVANLGRKVMYGEGYKRAPATRKRHTSKVVQPSNTKRRKTVQSKKKQTPVRKTTKNTNKKKKVVKRKLKDIFN